MTTTTLLIIIAKKTNSIDNTKNDTNVVWNKVCVISFLKPKNIETKQQSFCVLTLFFTDNQPKTTKKRMNSLILFQFKKVYGKQKI